MDIRKKRRKMFRLTILFFLLFLIMSGYFYSTIQEKTYIGIRAEKNENEWRVKRILLGGVAYQSDIKVNDIILRIDGHDIEDNRVLKRWLIVEQAREITIVREGEETEIIFENSDHIRHKFIVLFIICLIGYVLLFSFTAKQNNSKSSVYFYSLLIVVLFALIAVVPSSIGDSIGRFIIILTITIFPMHVKMLLCWKYKKQFLAMFNKDDVILCSIVIINTLLYIQVLRLGSFHMILSEYLAQGIFYVMGGSLLFVFRQAYQNKDTVNEGLKRSLFFLQIAIFFPFFCLYLFPKQWEIPSSVAIPFLFLSVLEIFYLLISSRRIFNKNRLTKKRLYFILGFIVTAIVLMLLELGRYVPYYVLVIYSFCLLYLLMPLIDEVLDSVQKEGGYKSLAIFSAVENERENISIFIHDTIIQEIIYFMKKVEIEGKEGVVSQKEVHYHLEEIVFNLRELCSDIYPLMIQEIGFINTLLALVEHLEQEHPVIIHKNIEVKHLKMSLVKSNFMIRTIKELMNNSILHGHAKEIMVLIREEENQYYFQVQDNGKFVRGEDEIGAHFGLIVIKEKVMLLKGEFFIDTTKGTDIRIYLPICDEEKGDENENCVT